MNKMIRHTASLLAALMLLPSLGACARMAGTEDRLPALTDDISVSVSDTQREENDLPIETPVNNDIPLTVETSSTDIPAALRTITVSNDTAVGGIISADSSFTVTTAAETDAQSLLRYLRVTPAAEFDVEGEGTSFTLRPRTILEANTLYRFTITDTTAASATLLTPASFAFQTADSPRITSVFPADRAEGVPVNTGIELTFNEVLASDADWEKYLTLEPAVPFRTEVYQHGKTLVIVPEQKLAVGTAYTVTAPAGLPLASGRVTAEAKVFTFRTEQQSVKEEKVALAMSVRERTGRTDEQISFQYNISGVNTADLSLDKTVCTIYRFPDAHAAAAALLDYEQNLDAYAVTGTEFRFDTKALEKIGQEKLTAEPSTNYTYGRISSWLVHLPALEAGCYVVDFTVSGKSEGEKFTLDGQLLVQSTDIEVSTAGAGEDLVLWVNENGKALSVPVSVHLYDRTFGWSLRRRTDGEVTVKTVSASSDKDGIALVKTEGRSCALAVIGEGENSRFVCIGGGSVSEISRRVYIYTDREQYYPNDTLRFWGAVTPAEGLTSLRVTSNAADPVTVEVLPDGTFSGSITWGDYAGYGVSLSFEENGHSIASAYKSITQEDKPVYTASVEMDQLYYRKGDTVTATLTATYFDGTPAGGLRFAWNVYGFSGGSGEVVTDDDGTATVSVKNFNNRPYSTAPQNLSVYFELIGNDSSSLYVQKNFLYFHSDLVLDIAQGEIGIDVTLHELDTSAMDDGSSYYTVQVKGAPAKGSVTVQLHRSWSERTVTGTRYDPVTKKNVEIVRTEWKEEIQKTFTASFENGMLTIPYVENPVAGSNYQYVISFQDGAYTYTHYQNGVKWNYASYDTGVQPQYKLNVTREDGTDARVNEYSTYAYVSPDEKLTFTVIYGEERVKNGRTLFVYMTPEGVASVRIGKDHGDTAVFDDSLSPYARVAALTVDDKTTVFSGTFDLQYNYQDLNTLSVTLTPEKDKCLPGETVHVTAQVKDADGNAVPSARVLLSLVDEANFAQRQQSLNSGDVLATIVRFYPIGSSVQQRYFVLSQNRRGYLYAADAESEMMTTTPETFAASMTAPMAPATGGAMKNDASGGGSVYVRENFADNPYFEHLTTDADGTVVFAVTIPDNITTWRLSAVAVSRDAEADVPVDLSAGTSVDAVICSQPFFISASVSDLYLTGDDIAFTGRYSGSEDSGIAAYTAVLEDSAGNVLAESAEEAGRNKTVFFNMKKVQAGEYFVRITARAGEKADAVRYPITVVDSAILTPVNRVLEPSELSSVQPSLYPLTLTFFDASDPLVSWAVSEILSSQNGRNDAKAAALAAYRICGELYGASSLYADRIADLLADVNTTGGARIYSYAEEDPVLTAKIALLLSDVLSYSTKQAYISYLSDTLVSAGDAKTIAVCLLGLASLNQPILGDLVFARENFASFKNADTEAKLYLAAAFAAVGDAASAAQLYIEAVNNVRVQEQDEIYLKGENTEETLALSYAALLCASLTDCTEAEGLMTYLSRRSSSYEMYVLETAVFAAAYAPESYEEKSFTYTLNGETITCTLNARMPVTLQLNRDSFASFALTDAHADIRIRAQYTGTPDQAAVTELDNVKVKKTVEPSKEGTDFYSVTVEITGTTDKDWFTANLTDRIPTGARFVRIVGQSFSGSSDTWGWIREENGHIRGTLSVYNRNVTTTAGRSEKAFTVTYSYMIRAYAPGEFVCESTYLVENGSGKYAASQRYAMQFD